MRCIEEISYQMYVLLHPFESFPLVQKPDVVVTTTIPQRKTTEESQLGNPVIDVDMHDVVS